MDLLHPAGKRSALHWQVLAKVLHLGAKGELAGVNAVELRGKHIDGVLEGEGLLGGRHICRRLGQKHQLFLAGGGDTPFPPAGAVAHRGLSRKRGKYRMLLTCNNLGEE
jgi:hypothetical protein